MARAFVDGELSENNIVELSSDESRHLQQVLRLNTGDSIQLVNGKGVLAEAVLTEVSKKACIARVKQVQLSDSRSRIHVAFGIPKQAALDFIIHRCTEVGVAGIQPLITQHSLKPDSWNTDRWQKVLREVCKQCEELFVPELSSPVKLDQWVSGITTRRRCLILCDEEQRSSTTAIPKAADGYDILIGPEGGWAKDEVKLLKSAGAVSLGLGKNRLRAETAALTALTLLKREIGET